NTKELFGDTKTIFYETKHVYKLDLNSLNEATRLIIQNNPLFKNIKYFIGYVIEGSNINQINFQALIGNFEYQLGEGLILETLIHQKPVLYQIISAKTHKEKLEQHSQNGFTVGIAQKLGVYNAQAKELETIKWLPEMFTPIFLHNSTLNNYQPSNCIGILPNTNLEIPIKDYEALVTHNTAILGILGIGKSC